MTGPKLETNDFAFILQFFMLVETHPQKNGRYTSKLNRKKRLEERLVCHFYISVVVRGSLVLVLMWR